MLHTRLTLVVQLDIINSPKSNETMVDTISKPWTTNIKFSRETVLGEGNSFVYQGTYKGQKIAVKRIVLERSLTNEFTLHNKIKHDNVLKLIVVEHDDNFR